MLRRQHPVSRLEGFSDAAFGFALTLLVVSGDALKTHSDLMQNMRQFVPFALTFAMICWIWYEHNVFFRRYGLQDPWTVFLNCVLLFVVLFYVYPLKYLATTLVGGLSGAGSEQLRAMDGQSTMLLYSGGVVMIFLTFVLLHWHASRRHVELQLDAAELLTLRYSTRAHLISMSIGLVSILIAMIDAKLAWLAGVIYGAMGPLHGLNGYFAGRALTAMETAKHLNFRPALSDDAGLAARGVPPAVSDAVDPPTV